MRLTICCLLFWEQFCQTVSAEPARNTIGPGSISGCGKPGLTKGSIQPLSTPNTYQEGDVVRYTCSPQHLLIGSDTRVCSEGRWNGTVPICANRLNLLNESQANTLQHKNASNALDGNYHTCTKGRWMYKSFWYATFQNNKTKVAAVRITFPQGATVNFSVRIIGAQGTSVSCGRKHLDIGLDTTLTIPCPRNTVGKAISITDLTEQANIFQLCEVETFTKENLTCRYPDFPLNSYSSFVFNNRRPTYRYECKEGYILIGPNETHCLSNGTWYPPPPICKAISCSRPLTFSNGNMSYNHTTLRAVYNETIVYSCHQGSTLSGDKVRRCLQEDIWSGEEPICIPVVATTQTTGATTPKAKECRPMTANVLDGHVLVVGNTAHLICSDGYEAVKDVRSVCMDDGRWSTYVFRCKAVRCSTLPAIQNGHVNISNTHKKLRIECQHGFVLNKYKLVHCQSNGEWSDTSEICLEATCVEPPIIEGGYWMPNNQTKFKMGDQINLHCSGGFKQNETYSATIQCQENGNWTTPNSTCHVLRTAVEAQGGSSSNLALFGSFLIGAATSIVVIGVIIFVFIRKKRQVTKHRSSQSIFHIAHPYFPTQTSRFSESAATETSLSEYNEDDHIYQAAIYKEIPLSQSDIESTLPKNVPVHLPLQAYYSQPFENKTTLADDFHIYSEPVEVRRTVGLNSFQSDCSSNNIYSDASSDNIYSCISDADNSSQQESIYPCSSTTTTTESVTQASTLQMRDNDLYETDSEDDVFT